MRESAAFVPSPTVASHELDSDTILFDRNGGRIFVLNETAAFVWKAIEHGLDYTEIAEEMAQRIGIERDRVLADCRSVLEQWRSAGLADGGSAPRAGLADAGSAPEVAVDPEFEWTTEPAANGAELPDWDIARRGVDERRRYRIADLQLNLDAPGEAFALIDGLLDHCRLPGNGLLDDAANDDTGNAAADDESATLTIARNGSEWVLFLEDIPLTGCDDDTKLAPMIHATVLHLSYAGSESLLSIHGAAVFSGGRCVLFPGQPGAGKSTLTAALVAGGFGYCTDDFVLLDGNPLRLRGVPLCIGLKKGSWPLLEGSIPAVASLPTHLREDGRQVRYLAPPPERTAAPDERFRAAAIVFPRVVQNAPCRLDRLSRSAALLQIADAGYHLLGKLDVPAFEAMLSWLRSLDCYELSYSDLDEAVAAVSGLLAPGGEPTLRTTAAQS